MSIDGRIVRLERSRRQAQGLSHLSNDELVGAILHSAKRLTLTFHRAGCEPPPWLSGVISRLEEIPHIEKTDWPELQDNDPPEDDGRPVALILSELEAGYCGMAAMITGERHGI